MNRLLIIAILFFAIALSACRDYQSASPKPRTYPRIDFPEKEYLVSDLINCDFQFEHPTYSKIEYKSEYYKDEAGKDCWFDLVFPSFNGRIHCSYYPINEKNKLDSLIYDSFALVGKHNIKAQYIKETKFDLKENGGGMMFQIKGPVASPNQFFVTDSSQHFFRGSLYFYNKVEVDSMRSVYSFVEKDIEHLLQSFTWK